MPDEGTCSNCQQGWDAEVRAAQLQQEVDRLRRAIYSESAAVADSAAPLHMEERGLNPELEARMERIGRVGAKP